MRTDSLREPPMRNDLKRIAEKLKRKCPLGNICYAPHTDVYWCRTWNAECVRGRPMSRTSNRFLE